MDCLLSSEINYLCQQRSYHNPKITTAWASHLNSFTTLPSQCEPDEDCNETFLCFGYGQSHSITAACSQWSALKEVPHIATEQTTSDLHETISSTFAAVVIKQEKQLIFIMRECFSSHTTALIIDGQKAETLRLAIIQSCIELIPLDSPFAVVRTDPAPGFQALANDPIRKSYRI